MRKDPPFDHYRSANFIHPSQRGGDVRHAAGVLLHLEYAYGYSAVREAFAVAKKSDLRLCGVCGEWTRHEEKCCQQCGGLKMPLLEDSPT